MLDLIERRRVARPRLRLVADRAGAVVGGRGLLRIAAGVADGWLLWAYERLLRRVVADTDLDLLHFSLHPLSAARVALEFALVLLHAAVIWGAAAIIRLPSTFWRTSAHAGLARDRRWRLARGRDGRRRSCVRRHGPARSRSGRCGSRSSLAGASAAALAPRRWRGSRRVSQSARLAIFFLALLVPALAMYPSLLAHATEAKERLVADSFGPQAVSQREDLQQRLQQAVEQIDAITRRCEEFVPARRRDADDRPRVRRLVADRARDLRLTSAVELYGADGRLRQPLRAEPAGILRPPVSAGQLQLG